jgi:hypothetical protein
MNVKEIGQGKTPKDTTLSTTKYNINTVEDLLKPNKMIHIGKANGSLWLRVRCSNKI